MKLLFNHLCFLFMSQLGSGLAIACPPASQSSSFASSTLTSITTTSSSTTSSSTTSSSSDNSNSSTSSRSSTSSTSSTAPAPSSLCGTYPAFLSYQSANLPYLLTSNGVGSVEDCYIQLAGVAISNEANFAAYYPALSQCIISQSPDPASLFQVPASLEDTDPVCFIPFNVATSSVTAITSESTGIVTILTTTIAPP